LKGCNQTMLLYFRSLVTIGAALLFWMPQASATCGEKGGSGYRGPDGHCVVGGVAPRLRAPPTKNCTPEQVAEGAGASEAAPAATAAAVGLLSSAPAPKEAGPIIGQASIVDGDTIEIHGQRIRLAGIDAPESDQLCRGADSMQYRCGQKAANDLAAFIDRRSVQCIEVDRDRYGRAVAVCTVAGVDIADWLVRSGLALDWPRYSHGDYAVAQNEAERADKGMWAGSFVKPWDYRPCTKSGGRIEWCSDEALK
jgi:endonuclease YncB( thermonuclease family)